MAGPDNLRILIVDDTEANIDILLNTLSDTYDISVAMDGASALEFLKNDIPDLILLDILMPGIDGYQVCRRIKADPRTEHIPVIFVTVQQDVDNETKGFSVGAVDYITKPFSPPVVKARVKTHMALKAASEKLKAQNKELKNTALLKEEIELMTRHDLKNPLSIILGVAELLGSDPGLSSSVRSGMETIQHAGLRMLHMINSSLDLFRMEKGTYELRSTRVDILKILQRISTDSQRSNQELQSRVKITTPTGRPAPGGSCLVMGEELLLHSMLANLINNALEASPSGEDVTIGIDCNDTVHISVHNHGEVPHEVRDRFFEKYVTSGKQRGTGLGTYTAKLIALTHGAEISLDTSQKGETTITVRLPSA